MPLGQGILGVLEAIPRRIEMSGHEPTWRITGGSFDDVLEFAHDVFEDPVVVGREDRNRWWPRVTLTVTTDRTRAHEAPPLDELRNPTVPAQREPGPAQEPAYSPLEEIFDHQDQLRSARVPRQQARGPAHRSEP